MAPYSHIVSRDAAINGSQANGVTPEIIAGVAFAGAILLGFAVWLGIYFYRKRTREPRDIVVKGVISESDEKAIPPKCVLLSCSVRVPFIENDRQFLAAIGSLSKALKVTFLGIS
jgi:hypothetical protein